MSAVKLAPGSHLGPYEIVALLGAGGMGEVYAARDTRLGRTVAVKTLPQEFADDATFKIRFEREAKAISALNHPHICALYDVGPDYFVMEHCEGTTLAARVAGRALPLAQVIDFGTQIADALDKAHRAGIVHRDLKPSNVMITQSGVKLLDFGLAKQHGDSSPDDSTMEAISEEGKIAGTPHYMAPEVLQGREADARSDIFALGLVLYEMASGKPAYSGSSRASIIAAILERDPPHVEAVPALDRVIQACLARDPEERVQTASEVKRELRWITEAAVPVQQPRGVRRRWIPALVVAVFVAAVVTAAYVARRLAPPERPLHATLSLPADVPLAPIAKGVISLSPDGTKVAMIVGPQENTSLAVYDLATGETKVLPGTETAANHFWSPDSQRIAFFARGQLMTVSASGGAVQVICPAMDGLGGAWSSRGVIVFTPAFLSPLYKVGDSGGTPIAITKYTKGEFHSSPVFLPDGETFLYVREIENKTGSGALYAGSITRDLEARILDEGSNAVYAGGHLLFLRDGNLVAQQFDPAKLAVSGPAVPIAGSVERFPPTHANFSANEQLLTYVPVVNQPRQIVAVDPKSGRTETIGAPGQYELVDVSRDGRKIALLDKKTRDIAILSRDGGVPERATFTNSNGVEARFSPDGTRLAYFTEGVSSGMVAEARADAPARPRTKGPPLFAIESLTSGDARPTVKWPVQGPFGRLGCWSPDGETLLLSVNRGNNGADIESLDIRSQVRTPVVATAANEAWPDLSPDGRWLAYMSDESGTKQVYVTAFPRPERKWQVSTDPGIFPKWSQDGRKLYFVTRGKLAVVDVTPGAAPQFSAPTPVPVAVGLTPWSWYVYSVAPDGMIITTRPAGTPEPRSIHLITNWTRLLP